VCQNRLTTTEEAPLTDMLLIATDGSLSSREAVDIGVRLARERGAAVTFVHSSPDLARMFFERNALTSPTRDEVAEADPVLRAALDRAVEAGVEADLRVLGEEGARDVASAIVGAGQGVHAALIVVGARGRGALTESVVGSVSRSVMETSRIPVVIVHAHAPAGDA
jgi:nucleotide-binding universal stress UspA family protein